jgi:pyridinium-3,5-bisthiocarboxylic acid mononucleotide nickel chelatase
LRIAYFDCIAGITGDSALGALMDAGVDTETLLGHLATLPLEPFELDIAKVEEQGIAATRVRIHSEPTGIIRTYSSMRSLIDSADLPAEGLRLSHRMLRLYAEADARVHRRDPEVARFSEITGLDTIIDIVGVATALTLLGVERVFSSAVPTGLGMAKSEHGAMPIPSPTVVELLRGAPLFSRGVAAELTNAVGAAILAATVEGYGDLPATRVEAVGYGAGSQRIEIPNLLRVLIGQEEPATSLPSPTGTPDLHLVTGEPDAVERDDGERA